MSGPVVSSGYWGEPLWQPAVEVAGLVVYLQPLVFVIALILLPFVCGLLARQQPILASLLFLLFMMTLQVMFAQQSFFAFSRSGEPVPFDWKMVFVSRIWLIAAASFITGIVVAVLVRKVAPMLDRRQLP